jgi:hypothetical protein
MNTKNFGLINVNLATERNDISWLKGQTFSIHATVLKIAQTVPKIGQFAEFFLETKLRLHIWCCKKNVKKYGG